MRRSLCLFLVLVCFGLPGQRGPFGLVIEPDQISEVSGKPYVGITINTQRQLSPRHVSDTEFADRVARLGDTDLPLYAANLFLPAELKVVGPDVDTTAVLAYADTVLRRASSLGIEIITWGSCGSRSLPEGFSPIEATAQFIAMARQVAELGARYGVTLAVENLNREECNFLNRLPEVVAVVRAVDHPRLRLCVDLYHMLVDGDGPELIRGVGPYVVYSELAERRDRRPPGTRGDDFTPYFRALRDEGFRGPYYIEARWNDLAGESGAAFRSLRAQWESVYLPGE